MSPTFLITTLLFSICAGVAVGGRPSKGRVLLKGKPWMLVGAVLLGTPHILDGIAPLVGVTGLGALIVACALNGKYLWSRLGALGITCNTMVILANGGRMPVETVAATLRLGPLVGVYPTAAHSALTPATKLPFLAEVIPVPGLDTIVSLGDLFVAISVFLMVQELFGVTVVMKRA